MPRIISAPASRQGPLQILVKTAFIFGRGGEEAEALALEGIPFEVVPGVSAGIAVPAYAGIPLTHRELTAEVTFLAGHRCEGASMDWDRIAPGNGTLVFFRGLRSLPTIAGRLIAHGRDPRTPVAVIQWGDDRSTGHRGRRPRGDCRAGG